MIATALAFVGGAVLVIVGAVGVLWLIIRDAKPGDLP